MLIAHHSGRGENVCFQACAVGPVSGRGRGVISAHDGAHVQRIDKQFAGDDVQPPFLWYRCCSFSVKLFLLVADMSRGSGRVDRLSTARRGFVSRELLELPLEGLCSASSDADTVDGLQQVCRVVSLCPWPPRSQHVLWTARVLHHHPRWPATGDAAVHRCRRGVRRAGRGCAQDRRPGKFRGSIAAVGGRSRPLSGGCVRWHQHRCRRRGWSRFRLWRR